MDPRWICSNKQIKCFHDPRTKFARDHREEENEKKDMFIAERQINDGNDVTI